jgi:hypothetical protein
VMIPTGILRCQSWHSHKAQRCAAWRTSTLPPRVSRPKKTAYDIVCICAVMWPAHEQAGNSRHAYRTQKCMMAMAERAYLGLAYETGAPHVHLFE